MRDLVNAKINEKKYEGILSPDELIDLIKKFKSDLQIDSMKTPFNLNKPNFTNLNFTTSQAENITNLCINRNNNMTSVEYSEETARNDDNNQEKRMIMNKIEIKREDNNANTFKDIKVDDHYSIINENDLRNRETDKFYKNGSENIKDKEIPNSSPNKIKINDLSNFISEEKKYSHSVKYSDENL